MILRYIAALIITILLLAVARRASTRHTEEFNVEVQGTTLTHHSVTEDFGEGPMLSVQAKGADGFKAVIFYSEKQGGPYQTIDMIPVSDVFTAKLPVLPKGQKWFYHIEVTKGDAKVATFPPDKDQFIKFKGHVSEIILVPHIFSMFATIFLGIMAMLTSFDIARGKGDLRRSVLYTLWTMIFAFIGGFPLGITVAYQAFGVGWGGIPLGWDITDNKTLVLFLLWLITFILARKGLRGDKMAISGKIYAFLVTLSFVVTFATFLIPHSI